MPTDPTQPIRLTPDQLAKWAERIADGRDAFPDELADPDRTQLADAVRLKLRDRLLRHVARAIAMRLANGTTTASQEKEDADS